MCSKFNYWPLCTPTPKYLVNVRVCYKTPCKSQNDFLPSKHFLAKVKLECTFAHTVANSTPRQQRVVYGHLNVLWYLWSFWTAKWRKITFWTIKTLTVTCVRGHWQKPLKNFIRKWPGKENGKGKQPLSALSRFHQSPALSHLSMVLEGRINPFASGFVTSAFVRACSCKVQEQTYNHIISLWVFADLPSWQTLARVNESQ